MGGKEKEVPSCPLGPHIWLHMLPQEVLPTRELPSYKGRYMENSRKFQKISPLRHTTQLPNHIPKTTQSPWVGDVTLLHLLQCSHHPCLSWDWW